MATFWNNSLRCEASKPIEPVPCGVGGAPACRGAEYACLYVHWQVASGPFIVSDSSAAAGVA